MIDPARVREILTLIDVDALGLERVLAAVLHACVGAKKEEQRGLLMDVIRLSYEDDEPEWPEWVDCLLKHGPVREELGMISPNLPDELPEPETLEDIALAQVRPLRESSQDFLDGIGHHIAKENAAYELDLYARDLETWLGLPPRDPIVTPDLSWLDEFEWDEDGVIQGWVLDAEDNEVCTHGPKKLSVREEMNEKYTAVMEDGVFQIFYEQEDPETEVSRKDPLTRKMVVAVPARKKWIRAKPTAFRQMLSNKKVKVKVGEKEKTVPLADHWLNWPKRRDAMGVIFGPNEKHPGWLNLWTGWGVEPSSAGSWDYLNELLFEVLADGNQEVYKYILDWSAHMIQFPTMPAEVAICFRGGKGVGKGTWGRALASLAGKHGMHIASSGLLTGRFNGHLRDLITLFADEAITPYDKDGENRLKALITEPTTVYEGKGRDAVSGRNMLHIIMASNDDWMVPAGFEERRFMVSNANQKRLRQHAWFAKLNDELTRGGGLNNLLWDLQNRDIGLWEPRESIPSTEALLENKLRSLDPLQSWWYNALCEGSVPFHTTTLVEAIWEEGPVRAFKADLRRSFFYHCKVSGLPRAVVSNGRGSDTVFGVDLKKLIPGLGAAKDTVPDDRLDINGNSDNRAQVYVIPPLHVCREAFSKLLGRDIDWTPS